jgi:hypothetical protein
VSEAAALVSKNAAAASAATASAVSGSGNGTFSAAALTGVNSVTAASSTNLTLAGGTAGTSSVVVSNTTAATTTASGALRVGSNVGLSGNAGGASYFGGIGLFSGNTLSVAGKLVNSAANGATIPASNGLFQVAGQAVNGLELIGKGSTTDFVLYDAAANTIADVPTSGNTLRIRPATSASNSYTGALVVGNGSAGSAATNVAIGGGNVNAGGTLTVGVGTLSGAKSTFRVQSVATSAATAKASSAIVVADSATGDTDSALCFGLNASSFYIQSLYTTVGTALALNPYGGAVNVPSSIASTLTTNGALVVTGGVGVSGAVNVGGAATFAGAVTAGGIVVKKNYTVATLPAAASWTYGEAYVSDATQAAGTSLGSAPTGGGAVKRGVYSDGAAWLLR